MSEVKEIEKAEDRQNREKKILEGAAEWGAFYRANPHRFIQDYLHIKLRVFQMMLLVMMAECTTGVIIGARGIGKSFVSALAIVHKMVLYPGSIIVLASGTKGQGQIILEKIINELIPRSPELKAEIESWQINSSNAILRMKNGSICKVVIAGETARGNRATALYVDEFRLVPKDKIDTILKKFLTQRRMPPFLQLTDAERNAAYDKEKSVMFLVSSAYFQNHWSYQKMLDTARNMLDPTRKEFTCALPYNLSIKEGLLDRTLVESEMAETDFSEIKFMMEYQSLWWGGTEGSLFNYNIIANNRQINYPMLPDRLASKLNFNSAIAIPKLAAGERRILSVDVALMSSKKNKNDATAVFVNQMLPTKSGRYVNNIVYAETYEGLKTAEQALVIRRMFDEFQCTDIVLDCTGLGLGVYDALTSDISDVETGEIFPALSCCNNQEMADRAPIGAPKVIWAIKANANLNSEITYMMREAFSAGRIRLLVNEYDCEELLSKLKGYNSLSDHEKMQIRLPFIQTTLLIDETVKLRYEESNGKIRVYELSGNRKDRYSSLSYSIYVANQIEKKIRKKKSLEFVNEESFIIRPPKFKAGGGVLHGKNHSWH